MEKRVLTPPSIDGLNCGLVARLVWIATCRNSPVHSDHDDDFRCALSEEASSLSCWLLCSADQRKLRSSGAASALVPAKSRESLPLLAGLVLLPGARLGVELFQSGGLLHRNLEQGHGGGLGVLDEVEVLGDLDERGERGAELRVAVELLEGGLERFEGGGGERAMILQEESAGFECDRVELVGGHRRHPIPMPHMQGQ